uniref:Uncharacterized protein n=1 Tax=Anguilla anguilla TaxID=7936 RepID=A0A0E9R376_ANGAN
MAPVLPVCVCAGRLSITVPYFNVGILSSRCEKRLPTPELSLQCTLG